MAHTAPPRGNRRRIEMIVGGLAVLVAIALILLAVVALAHPKGRNAGTASTTTSVTPTVTSSSASPTGSGTSSVVSPPSAPSSSVSPTATPSASKTTAVSTATSSAKPKPSVSTIPSSISANFPLVVLNNTSDTAATATAAARFRARGWSVTDTGAFDGSIISTAAYYDPDVTGSENAALMLQKEFPAIQRVRTKFSGLPNGPIVVVLTSDYS